MEEPSARRLEDTVTLERGDAFELGRQRVEDTGAEGRALCDVFWVSFCDLLDEGAGHSGKENVSRPINDLRVCTMIDEISQRYFLPEGAHQRIIYVRFRVESEKRVPSSSQSPLKVHMRH